MARMRKKPTVKLHQYGHLDDFGRGKAEAYRKHFGEQNTKWWITAALLREMGCLQGHATLEKMIASSSSRDPTDKVSVEGPSAVTQTIQTHLMERGDGLEIAARTNRRRHHGAPQTHIFSCRAHLFIQCTCFGSRA